jgi:hypothetical protein
MILEVTQIFLNLKSVTLEINSENEETEEVVSDARAKRPRLEDQGEWHWEKVD